MTQNSTSLAILYFALTHAFTAAVAAAKSTAAKISLVVWFISMMNTPLQNLL